jgi:CDP-diacylglycerol---serine O-phosphatidyltransferase
LKLLQHIPNAFTLVNLLAGTIAIIYQDITTSLVCLAVSLIADVLDGAMARLLKASSPIGKVLDTLADMVSFGVMPAVVTYGVYFQNSRIGLVAILFFVAMAALRLARFTVSEDENIDFRGLPTPASALIVGGMWLYYSNGDILSIGTPGIIAVLVLCGMLNMSSVRMYSLKHLSASRFKQIAFAFLGILALALAIVQPSNAILFVMLSYIGSSIIYHLMFSNTERTM